MDDEGIPYVFSLTPLTGRGSGGNRRVIVQGFDVPWRSVIIALTAAPIGVIAAAIAWLFIGEYALAVLFIVEGIAFWLVESRSRRGLHLRTYQTLLDKKKHVDGQLIMCGRPIDAAVAEEGTIRQNTVPVDPVTSEPSEILADAMYGSGRVR